MSSSKGKWLVCCAGLALITSVGCGDDGGAEVTAGGTGGGGEDAGGLSGTGAGFEPIIGDERGPSLPFGPSCDSDGESVTERGGTACEPLEGQFVSFLCAVVCCTEDDQCGTRRAFAEDPTDCEPPSEPDPACPEFQVMGMTLPGCCASSGQCGLYTTIDRSCSTSSFFLPDLEPGDPCGQEPTADAGRDGSVADAGMDADVEPDSGGPKGDDDAGVAEDDAGP